MPAVLVLALVRVLVLVLVLVLGVASRVLPEQEQQRQQEQEQQQEPDTRALVRVDTVASSATDGAKVSQRRFSAANRSVRVDPWFRM